MGKRASVLWIARVMAGMFLHPFFHLKASGLENLPVDGAFILLPKHQRWEDIPLLSLATPRSLYFVAKRELFMNPLSNRVFLALGGIPLDRQRPLKSKHALQSMLKYLKKGEGVVVFPEGTYYRDEMGPGHLGVIRLVVSQLSLPFVPVGIRYSAGKFRTLVSIRFGRPCYAVPGEPAVILLSRIMEDIAMLSALN